MFKKIVLGTCVMAVAAFSADHQFGTWKLNTAKSKYTGMPTPKSMTATYTQQGSGWRYSATGVSATGEPVNASFAYVKDNEDIKTTGFPYWDTLVLRNGNADKGTGTFKRQGKVVGSLTRTISADGKTMTIDGKVTLPDGKEGTYHAVYEKQ